MSEAPVVAIKDVVKTFKGGTTALQGIELDILPGEFVSLIGPSGCGKSTLLRIIGDLIQPSSGDLTVNGKSAHQARLDRDYGIVFQDSVLYDWRTVAKNIHLPLEMLGWDRRRRGRRGERRAAPGRRDGRSRPARRVAYRSRQWRPASWGRCRRPADDRARQRLPWRPCR